MLDLILIAILVLCVWRGFKSGLINSIIGVIAVILTVYLAGLTAQVYSGEFVGMLEPFVSGVVDSKVTSVTTWNEGDKESEGKKAPAIILSSEQKRDVYTVCRASLICMGLEDKPAEDIAASTARIEKAVGQNMCVTLTALLCRRILYVATFFVAFIVIAVALYAVGSILDMKFGVPGFENISHISGGVLGLFKGCLIILTLSCFFRYLGIIVPDKLMESTHIFKKLVADNFIANHFGI